MFKKVFASEKLDGKIAIYGAGLKGKTLCDQLIGNGFEVMCFCDSNTQKHETEYRGIKVVSKADLFELCSAQKCFVFIEINGDAKELVKTLSGRNNIIVIEPQNESFYLKEIRDYYSLKLDIHLVDECNLNCKGCSHFSPLAIRDNFRLKLEDFEKDIIRIKEVFGDRCEDMIYLIGGEPLLHDRISEFSYVFRRYLNNTQLFLFTNGILLKKQNESFWESCRINNVKILITKYPINMSYKEIEEIIITNNVDYEILKCNIGRYTTLDFESENDCRLNFRKCSAVEESCSTLKDGMLYPCVVAPHFHLFREFYNVSVDVPKGISLYEDFSREEFLFKLANDELEFCRYCDFNKVVEWDWSTSKYECSEWCSNVL